MWFYSYLVGPFPNVAVISKPYIFTWSATSTRGSYFDIK